MTVVDFMPAFLVACPSIEPAWLEHLAFWGDVQQRGVFNDAAVVAHHLVYSVERGELSEFPAVFALLERCLVEGDENVREFATLGVIEGIQNIASHRSFGPMVFYDWLGTKSRVAWDELCVSWQRIAEAKAAGLLEPQSGQAAAMPVDPSEIQDPDLRRIMEQIFRK